MSGYSGLPTIVAGNLVRGRIGRSWMMIRDMDIAAELMGMRLCARNFQPLCLPIIAVFRRFDGVSLVAAEVRASM